MGSEGDDGQAAMAHEKKPYNFTPNPHAGIGYTLQSPYSYKHIDSFHHFLLLVFVGSWVCDYDITKCRIIYSWARFPVLVVLKKEF